MYLLMYVYRDILQTWDNVSVQRYHISETVYLGATCCHSVGQCGNKTMGWIIIISCEAFYELTCK